MDKASVIQSWIELAGEIRGTVQFDISWFAFNQILQSRQPGIPEVADAINRPEHETKQLVQGMVDQGRLSIHLNTADDTETICGAGGLSAVPSRHTVEIDGKTFWGWCAMDVVGIPAGIAADAVATSTASDTGESVIVRFEKGRLAEFSPSSLTIALAPASLHRPVHADL